MDRNWLEKDFYLVLGVDYDVDPKSLTREYRKLARKYHPDANPGDLVAEENFKAVSEAYDVLSDPAKRSEYDQVRSSGVFGVPGVADSFDWDTDNVSFSDIFGAVFPENEFSKFTKVFSGQESIEVEVNVDFLDALKGSTVFIDVPEPLRCDRCVGTGALPTSTVQVCGGCGGTGNVSEQQSIFSMVSTCGSCGGTGKNIINPCDKCLGFGVVEVPRKVGVKLPRGFQDGQVVRIKGGGTEGNKLEMGDVIVVGRVAPHPFFSFSEGRVLLDVPVTFPELVLGGSIEVPTPLDGVKKIVLPPGTPNNKSFRIPSDRLPNQGCEMVVTVAIDIPAEVTSEQKQLLESYMLQERHSPRLSMIMDVGGGTVS